MLLGDKPLTFEQPPSAVEGKGYGIRVLSYVIDFGFIYILNGFASLLFNVILYLAIEFIFPTLRIEYLNEGSRSDLTNLTIGIILMVIYFILFESMFGRSFAKLILGMIVINYEGRICSLCQAFVRAIHLPIDGFFFGLIALNNMRPPFQQRYGDKRAKTIVVSKRCQYVKETRSWWKFVIPLVLYIFISGIVQIIFTIPYIRIS
jgi:uncharacterized RDD family membrane protein YckC